MTVPRDIENRVALGITTDHPGVILGEWLEEHQMTQAEFAQRCDLTPKHVNRIIRGRSGYSPEVAVRFERVTGASARFWLMAQANHGLAMARAAQA